jgi:hypothetical protein
MVAEPQTEKAFESFSLSPNVLGGNYELGYEKL